MLRQVMVQLHRKIKTTKTNIMTKKNKIISASLFALAIFMGVTLSVLPPGVVAESISETINNLQAENANNRKAVADLKDQAVSYQDAITRLQSQINILQGSINENQAKQANLQRQIEENQKELERQKATLGDNIRVMYVEGQITTIEMLLTSKDFSHFIDKQEYHNSLKNKIQETVAKITTLQEELNAQKQRVVALLNDQRSQQADLDKSRQEQSNMLTYNQQQQADFNAKTKANQQRINDLIAQQLRANSALPASGYYFLRFPGKVKSHSINVDDYPYADDGFSMSTAPGCNDGDGPDRWGYCTRQCVSYAAWAVERSGRAAPRYYGSAKYWVRAAQNDGVTVTTTPEVGDVAISTSGTWGHAMYVEDVDGDRILVSQYNQQLNGRYSTQWREYR